MKVICINASESFPVCCCHVSDRVSIPIINHYIFKPSSKLGQVFHLCYVLGAFAPAITMQPTIVTLAFLATSAMSIALPQDVDDNDIPSQCTAVCQSVVALTQQCDRDINNDNSDVLYRNCICTAEGASTVIPICEACVRQYRPTTTTTDDDGEVDQDTNGRKITNGALNYGRLISFPDVDDVVRACNFSTTTYDASQTSSLSIGSGVTTATATATTGSTGGGSGTVTNAVGTGTSNAESGASSLSSGVATAASQGSGAMPTAGVGAGIAAIVGVAALI